MLADAPTELPDVSFRAFVALEVSEHVRAALASTIGQLRRHAPTGVSWVPPANLHVSLAFLGDVSPDGADLVAIALDEVAAVTAPFSADVHGVGCFGQARHPRVVWAGVEGGDALANLYPRVAQGLAVCGVTLDDRPFRGHITLGRVKTRNPPERLLRELGRLAASAFGVIRVDAIDLMRSTLAPSGARYDRVRRFGLRGLAATDAPR